MCPRTDESVTTGPCGTTIDRYFVEKRLGGGGFGSVYLARHSVLGQHVALKLLLPQHTRNREVVARFVREAKSAASIKSKHIVAVSDFGTTQTGEAFLVMELLEGRDLETIITEEGKFAVEWALRFTEQILDGLSAAHAVGVVHRDMKPANVFVSRAADGTPWVKLVDFGISKANMENETQNLTRTGAVIGTPAYMSPEQFTGMREVDHRTDIYAVAVVLYQMLSGRLPYDENTYERLILKVVTEGPTPLRQVAPDLPEPVLALVERGLKREPSDRFQSADEFKNEALRVLSVVTGSGRKSAPPPSAVNGPSQTYAASQLLTPATQQYAQVSQQHHTPAPQQHYTPQQYTPQPFPVVPQQHFTPQQYTHQPFPVVPQPSTPMAFDRPSAAQTMQTRKGPSPALIVFGILCGIGLLATGVLLLVAYWSDEPDDSFASGNSGVTVSEPVVSNGDSNFAVRAQSVLEGAQQDFGGCRLQGIPVSVQVQVTVQGAQIVAPMFATNTPEGQVAQCLATSFAQRANETGPWLSAEGETITFSANAAAQ